MCNLLISHSYVNYALAAFVFPPTQHEGHGSQSIAVQGTIHFNCVTHNIYFVMRYTWISSWFTSLVWDDFCHGRDCSTSLPLC